jgi:hypothetical protein
VRLLLTNIIFSEIIVVSMFKEASTEVPMYHFSPRVFLTLTLAVAGTAVTSQVHAQASLANMSTTPKSMNSNDASNKSWHDSTPDKLISAQVRDGVLTIDGMVAKVQLNYEIQRAGYMYFFVPGMGTAVVSLAPLEDSVKIKNAFDGTKLEFAANGHTFVLTSKSNILTKDKSQKDIYVRLDRSTVALARYPRMGYGSTTEPPYVWPLSGVTDKDRDAHLVVPPPLPKSVLQTAAPVPVPQQ